MLPSIFVYIGFVLAFVGLICLIKPLHFLHIAHRRQALGVVVVAGLFVIAGFSYPIKQTVVVHPQTALDRFAPKYQFSECHSIRINAPRTVVYKAISEVTAEEISLYKTLAWMRRAGQSGRESILNPAPGAPIMQVALRSGFVSLADEPGREVVFGAPVLAPRGFRLTRKVQPDDFIQTAQPGFGFAVMNFYLADAGAGGTLLTTETRIFASDSGSARRFARCWSVVYPGSALIRYSWLRAIKHRAEVSAQN